jgi:UDP-3-O-[3-hydroxymyristoyl] glucosamine N-acyltransferase
MKLSPSIKLKDLADFLGRSFVGPENHLVSGINEIHKVEKGDLVFVDHPKYYDKALACAATTVLIDQEVDCPEGKGLIISPEPFNDYNKLTKHYAPFRSWESDRGDGLVVGEGTIIQPNVTIGHNVKIGSGCLIASGVVIGDNSIIGDRVIIHSGAVLGGDAFYYKKTDGQYNKMHSCGHVVLEDDVEIGALCTIDRGVSGDTRVGKGSKLDNQVHVGHDTVIGQNCLLAAQVGLAGCVILEDGVTLWGQVGVPSDVRIGANAVVMGQSGVMSSVEGGKSYLGSPAREAREKLKEIALIRKLPDLLERLKNKEG